MNSKVDSIPNAQIPLIALSSKLRYVRLDSCHLIARYGPLIKLLRPRGSLSFVVVRVWGVRELEFLGKLDGRHRAVVSESNGVLYLPLHALLNLRQLYLCDDSSFLDVGLKYLYGILRLTGPLLLILPPPFVLWVRRGVPIEPIGVNLKNGWSLLPDVVDGSPTALDNVGYVLPVHEYTGDAVVLALFVDIGVRCDVGGEGVDGATVVNHDYQEREVVLGGGVEDLGLWGGGGGGERSNERSEL